MFDKWNLNSIFMGDFIALWSSGFFSNDVKNDFSSKLGFSRTSDLREHLLRNQSCVFSNSQLENIGKVIGLERLQKMIFLHRYKLIDNSHFAVDAEGNKTEEQALGIMNFLRLDVRKDGEIGLFDVFKGEIFDED